MAKTPKHRAPKHRGESKPSSNFYKVAQAKTSIDRAEATHLQLIQLLHMQELGAPPRRFHVRTQVRDLSERVGGKHLFFRDGRTVRFCFVVM
jgi:hypothetical protein